MAILHEIVFTLIPLLALLCNIFLLFTMLTAKKDASIYSFMGLLTAFILWTGGAYMMRSQVYPSVGFWWRVSLTGIFLVPYMYYLLVAAYVGKKGMFRRLVYGILSVIIVVLNIFGVFMSDPELRLIDGVMQSTYTVRWTAVFPVILTVVIFIAIALMIAKVLRDEDMLLTYISPLLIGIVFMMVGIIVNTFFSSLPTDTLGCAINAICIYYAFYKKRFYALNQITSKGSMYLVTLIVTGLTLTASYEFIGSFLSNHLIAPGSALTMPLIITSSAVSILLFSMLNRLNDALFVRDQIHKEGRVQEFSSTVNATLKTEEILHTFQVLIKEEIDVDHIYLCMYDEETGNYISERKIGSLERCMEFRNDHPLVSRFRKQESGFAYSDFQRTNAYKSMWEAEKKALQEANATYMLPFCGEKKQILGFAILSKAASGKLFSYMEINFMESVASVASMALKNAMLYRALEKEALMDPLTGLLNRRTLIRHLEEQFELKASPITLVSFNLDDFSLYNELYGSEEGDRMLQRFADLLTQEFGSDVSVARYGGKEFVVLLPYYNTAYAVEKTENVRKKLSDYIMDSREKTKKFLTFSAGICSYPVVAANANQLLSYANMAVYRMKQHGKNGIEVYQQQNEYPNNEYGVEDIQQLTSTIYALTAAIDAKDHYTFNHSQCVAKYAQGLAKSIGLDEEHCEIIRQAGLLHDIGKIGIPDAILTKKGALTPPEFSIMREHVERSIEMIRHLPSLDYVVPAVLGHHERYDGKGYPRGISGEDIPIAARCLAIADAFDAMVSKRSYKNKMPIENALSEIEKNLGSQFDPQLGRQFINLVKDGTIEVIHY